LEPSLADNQLHKPHKLNTTNSDNPPMKKILITMGLVLLAYLTAAPYITVYQIKAAAKARDGEALSEHIDFPSVRERMKSDLKAKFMDSILHGDAPNHPLAIFGSAFADTIINKMVDAYMTPSGVIYMMAGHPPEIVLDGEEVQAASTTEAPFKDATMAYESLNKFVVTAQNTKGETSRFILRRRGLTWQLAEIVFDARP
jgi:Protein of unknown function (DUF2939)